MPHTKILVVNATLKQHPKLQKTEQAHQKIGSQCIQTKSTDMLNLVLIVPIMAQFCHHFLSDVGKMSPVYFIKYVWPPYQLRHQ